MEALILIFAEIIAACLAPLLSLLGALVGMIFEFLALILSRIFGRSVRKTPTTRKTSPKPLKSRKALHWTAGILGGLGATGLLASVVLFEPLLRGVLTRATSNAGIDLSYEGSSGFLLAGKVELTGLALARSSDTGLAFDLEVDQVVADVDLWSLLTNEPRLELGAVRGLTGSITPPQSAVRLDSANHPGRTRRAFRADRLTVENIDVLIAPHGSDPYRLDIASGEVAPFRSQSALFDLLFRSNLEAEVAGQPLLVETRQISANGRETLWHFDEVEVDRLKLIVPKAPLTWLSAGTATLRVDDRWNLDDEVIDMDWRVVLSNLAVTAPAAASASERALAGGLSRVLDAQGGNADVHYRLDLGPEQVSALREGDLSAFWDAVLSGFVGDRFMFGEESDPDDTSNRLRRTFDALRDRLTGNDADQ
jgi:hypothetical protein